MLPRTANYMHEVHLANANRTHYSQEYALQLFIHEGRKSIFSYFKMSQMMNRFCFLAETLQLPVYAPHVFIFCTVFTWILGLSFWWKKVGCFAFDCMCRWISIHLDQILNKKKKEWKTNEPTIIQSSNGQQVDWDWMNTWWCGKSRIINWVICCYIQYRWRSHLSFSPSLINKQLLLLCGGLSWIRLGRVNDRNQMKR
jgi:hypothetical protein